MSAHKMTPRQRELVGHFAAYRAEHKRAPTHAEVAALMKCSKQNVSHIVAELVERGILAKEGTAHRNIKVLE